MTGVLHRLNSKSLPAHSLRPVHEGAIELDQITNTWALEKKHMEEASISSVGGLPWFPQLQARRAVDPSREEISDLLQEDERVRVDILGHEVVSRSLCDVPTTMCLSVDTSSSFTPMWSLHQERIPRTGLLGWRPTCNRTLGAIGSDESHSVDVVAQPPKHLALPWFNGRGAMGEGRQRPQRRSLDGEFRFSF